VFAIIFIVVIRTVCVISIRALLVVPILIFGTVSRGFRASIAASHNVWYIHDFGLFDIGGFRTRCFARYESRCFSPVVSLRKLAPASEALILAVLVTGCTPPLPLIRVVVINYFIV
jgi:hypothetical protein